jgi:bifunctional non-homologous end joining protein LigD
VVRRSGVVETRDGVDLTHLDSPLFDGAGVSKRQLVDYLDGMSARLLPELADRPLSVVRVRPGQPPFMQKNLPAYAPDWIPRVAIWSAASRRDVSYPLCHDRRTLLWLANQRAVEFHPTLLRGSAGAVTHLVLDLDPPEGAAFGAVVRAAAAVRTALAGAGLEGAVKTSGAKGLHIVVPVVDSTAVDAAAAATRALAARTERLDPEAVTTAYVREEREGKVFADSTRSGGATVVAAYSPRARPGVPVSFPVPWDDLDAVVPGDFTVTTAAGLLGDSDRWRSALPPPQRLPDDLVAEGHTIPVARVVAMHEGKRRKRAAAAPEAD